MACNYTAPKWGKWYLNSISVWLQNCHVTDEEPGIQKREVVDLCGEDKPLLFPLPNPQNPLLMYSPSWWVDNISSWDVIRYVCGKGAFGVERGWEWRSSPLERNRIANGSGARKLIGGHGRPRAKYVWMLVVGPPGASRVGELVKGGEIGR